MTGTISRSWLTPTICAIIVCIAATTSVTAEEPLMLAWKTQIGTSEWEEAHSVAVDAMGNSYITGYSDGGLDGAYTGYSKTFLIKFDPIGVEVWRRQIGTNAGDRTSSVAVDTWGYPYIAGYTTGHLGGLNAGYKDAFLVKLDTDGNMLWSRQIGTSSQDVAHSVAVDTVGNAYIAGYTDGSLDGASTGGSDAFLIKFDANGGELWRRQIGTSDADIAYSVAVDAIGNPHITGSTTGSLGGPSAGHTDAFLIKLDASGNEHWRKQFGTSGGDEARSVAVDPFGNAFIAGRTTGSLFGSNAGFSDAFYIMVLANGDLHWRKQFGTIVPDAASSVAVDAFGNIFITGTTEGFLNGPDEWGSEDVFLISFRLNGDELWRRQFGDWGELEFNASVAVDATGGVFIAGTTTGTLGGSNIGSADVFVLKLDAEGVTGCIDGDGDVDLDDFVILKSNFGSTSAVRSEGDLDGDGDVDLDDFVILKTNFGTNR